MIQMESKALRVLLIDDDEDYLVITRDLLDDIEGGRFDIEWADSFDTGLARLTGSPFDVCLLGV